MLDQSVLRLIEWQRSLAASLPSRWLMVFDFVCVLKIGPCLEVGKSRANPI